MKQENLIKIKEELERIKNMDYIKSLRKGEFGAKITFKHIFNNNDPEINIMIKHIETRKYITIFSASPDVMEKEFERLRNKYGYLSQKDGKTKILETSVQGNCFSMVGTKFLFKLLVDREKEKIILIITDKNYVILEKKDYWSFELIKKRLNKKAKYLIIVKSWLKKEENIEYYKYYDYDIYELKSLENFLKLIERGIIRITFRINVFSRGINKGKIYDKGTMFEIEELDMYKIYDKINI